MMQSTVLVAAAVLLLASSPCHASNAGKRPAADILPAAAFASPVGHKLSPEIDRFLKTQAAFKGFRGTGLRSSDYLDIIIRQVRSFRSCQDAEGRIIDPVQKIEWQYSTPCYALSAALLVATGYDNAPGLLESAVRAMSASVDAMSEYRCAHNHGEFYIQPVMLALDLLEPLAPAATSADWKQKIAALDPYKLYPDNLDRKTTVYNHNLVALAGERLRAKKGLGADEAFFRRHLPFHLRYITPLGMYCDPGAPMVYDEFSRHYIAGMLAEGYRGPYSGFFKGASWKGAWTSLFLQSPFGEGPTGGRSAQHIWNEAQMAVTCEIYASAYASAGRLAEAGAFKRAAHLCLGSIKRWMRPDGSGYVVKNRFPISSQHGYERYSAQSQYNLLACAFLAEAYAYASDNVREAPSPADVGGFVIDVRDNFHKVFANAGGAYIEYDTSGDLHYNPTGLIRIHLQGSNPQLGPSDGIVHKFDAKKQDLGGQNMAVGPAWQTADGQWHRLADHQPASQPALEVLEATPARAKLRISYSSDLAVASEVSQTITLQGRSVTVEDNVVGPEVKAVRSYWPMLVFDGLEETERARAGHQARLGLRDGSINFRVEAPPGAALGTTEERLDFRNGVAEGLYIDSASSPIIYRIWR